MEKPIDPTAPNEKSPELILLQATAIRQAMVEVMAEQQPEIIRRAKAKLVAMGVTIEDAEVVP